MSSLELVGACGERCCLFSCSALRPTRPTGDTSRTRTASRALRARRAATQVSSPATHAIQTVLKSGETRYQRGLVPKNVFYDVSCTRRSATTVSDSFSPTFDRTGERVTGLGTDTNQSGSVCFGLGHRTCQGGTLPLNAFGEAFHQAPRNRRFSDTIEGRGNSSLGGQTT